MRISRGSLTQPAGADLREEERLGVLALRDVLGLNDRITLSEVTLDELDLLRKQLQSGLNISWHEDSEKYIARDLAASAARERLHHLMEHDLSRRLAHLKPLIESRERSFGAVTQEDGMSSNQPPITESSPSAETGHPAPSPSEAATAETQSVTFTFNAAEVRELEPWTEIEAEALRGFMRSALGNYLFIQQQYGMGNDFLLQEYRPDGKAKRELRRVRFR